MAFFFENLFYIMKKYLVLFALTGLLTLNSCRETTQQKTQDAVESIGEDIEENTKKAGKKIEEGAKKVREEVQEEMNETDDHHS